ncbi:Major allergen [Wickerhamomyces ciferrii]|uniref:Major allergen n=1 Tax=Wickerhamomyces ciferrii (strain ATCC 14091 / BCRC 22168 / CBS 111 / JCM 3599 / NBRC 0793 / NRRL Y-1031 F-60-10) TaxID=1206466 RepID=K0KSF2_WICCF|nr:Major allergen [Wickerhamomyces ciferrii]CCH44952.1 Major allergen [Wickerhamomyces ciferrii]
MKFFTVGLLASIALASPIIDPSFVNEQANNEITTPKILNCNSTQTVQLKKYYKDLIEFSTIAKQNLLKNGGDDQVFKNWFGKGNPLTVLGIIDEVLEGNKDGVLYRCDDIDGDCAAHPTEWPGYHRSSDDHSGETVICDLFFNSKHPIEKFCSEGDILTIKPKTYAGIDLFHRFLHLSKINKGYYGEYAEEFKDLLDYAENNITFAVLNTDNILYYIAESYSLNLTGSDSCLGNLSNSTLTN